MTDSVEIVLLEKIWFAELSACHELHELFEPQDASHQGSISTATQKSLDAVAHAFAAKVLIDTAAGYWYAI